MSNLQISDSVSKDVPIYLCENVMCRLCGCTGNNTDYIHLKEACYLVKMIKYQTQITIKNDDIFPKTVCRGCIDKIHMIQHFRSHCRKTQKVLETMYEKNSEINNTNQNLDVSSGMWIEIASDITSETVDCESQNEIMEEEWLEDEYTNLSYTLTNNSVSNDSYFTAESAKTNQFAVIYNDTTTFRNIHVSLQEKQMSEDAIIIQPKILGQIRKKRVQILSKEELAKVKSRKTKDRKKQIFDETGLKNLEKNTCANTNSDQDKAPLVSRLLDENLLPETQNNAEKKSLKTDLNSKINEDSNSTLNLVNNNCIIDYQNTDEQESEIYKLVSENSELIPASDHLKTNKSVKNNEITSENLNLSDDQLITIQIELLSDEYNKMLTQKNAVTTKIVNSTEKDTSINLTTDPTEIIPVTNDLTTNATEILTDSTDIITDSTEMITDTTELLTHTSEMISNNTEIITDATEDISKETKIKKGTNTSETDNANLQSKNSLPKTFIRGVNYRAHCGKNGRKVLSNEIELPDMRIDRSGRVFQTNAHKYVEKVSEKEYRCMICEKSFRFPFKAELHIRTHTGEKPFTCKHCGKSFITGFYLLKHEKTHSSRQYICEICGKNFREIYTLNDHQRIHQDTTPKFHCSFCNKQFYVKSHFDSHKQTHAEKKHICEVCGKQFSLHSMMLRHKNRHGNEKFQCLKCPKVLKTKEDVIQHKKRHEKNGLYQCKPCSLSFWTVKGLQMHEKQVHNGTLSVDNSVFINNSENVVLAEIDYDYNNTNVS